MRSNCPSTPSNQFACKAYPVRHPKGLRIAFRNLKSRRRKVTGNGSGLRQFGQQRHRNGPGARAKVQNAQRPSTLRQRKHRSNERFRVGTRVQYIRRHPEIPAIEFAGTQECGKPAQRCSGVQRATKNPPSPRRAKSNPVPPRYLRAASPPQPASSSRASRAAVSIPRNES